MADLKSVKTTAMGHISAALTIAQKFPDLNSSQTLASFDGSANPFAFLLDMFKLTAGYNAIITMLAQYISKGIPALEIAVKGILLSNMKNLLSCSLNPFISKDILLNGMVFDLKNLDIANLLQYCPLDKDKDSPGKYLYFGCDDFKLLEDLKDARDFNAFLWYIKNRAVDRECWFPNNLKADNAGRPASHAILTLEYHENPISLKNAIGEEYTSTQTPHGNCLHVFIGDTRPTNATRLQDLKTDLSNKSKQISDTQEEIYATEDKIEEKKNRLKKLRDFVADQVLEPGDFEEKKKKIDSEVKNLATTLTKQNQDIEKAVEDKAGLMENINIEKKRDFSYPDIKDNYYYRKTLIQFNIDYIMSVKLFDEKVVTAMLVDALTNCFKVDLHMSYELLFIKNETERMVQGIIESDDVTVSDCFFTFDNKEYNAMLNRAELIREGLYVNQDGETTGARISADAIMGALNGLSDNASQEVIQSVFEGSMREVSGMISDVSYEIKDKGNFNAQLNFIENILNKLAYVLTVTILSPKVYLLIAVNLKLMGEDPNFDINAFIERFKNLIVQLIRAVRDEIMKFLLNKLMEYLAPIINAVAKELTFEQVRYYKELITKLINCFKGNPRTLDFIIDEVNYADIYEQEGEPQEDNC